MSTKLEHGAYWGTFVIRFLREVKVGILTFSAGETLVCNGKHKGRWEKANADEAFCYPGLSGDEIPAGSYKIIGDYRKVPPENL